MLRKVNRIVISFGSLPSILIFFSGFVLHAALVLSNESSCNDKWCSSFVTGVQRQLFFPVGDNYFSPLPLVNEGLDGE